MNCLRRAYSGRSLFLRSQAIFFKCHAVKDGTRPFEQWGERMSGNAMKRGA